MTGRTNEGQIASAVCCKMGRARTLNEDGFYLNGHYKNHAEMEIPVLWSKEDDLPALYAVFDGLWDNIESLEFISSLSTHTLHDAVPQILLHPSDAGLSIQSILELRKSIRDEVAHTGHSTAVALMMAVVHPDGLEVYNMGSNRAYLLRGSTLSPIFSNPDPDWHGSSPDMSDENLERTIQHCHIDRDGCRNRRLLLCSDGVGAVLSEQEISRLLSGAPDPEAAVDALVARALESGSGDNATALTVWL